MNFRAKFAISDISRLDGLDVKKKIKVKYLSHSELQRPILKASICESYSNATFLSSKKAFLKGRKKWFWKVTTDVVFSLLCNVP